VGATLADAEDWDGCSVRDCSEARVQIVSVPETAEMVDCPEALIQIVAVSEGTVMVDCVLEVPNDGNRVSCWLSEVWEGSVELPTIGWLPEVTRMVDVDSSCWLVETWDVDPEWNIKEVELVVNVSCWVKLWELGSCIGAELVTTDSRVELEASWELVDPAVNDNGLPDCEAANTDETVMPQELEETTDPRTQYLNEYQPICKYVGLYTYAVSSSKLLHKLLRSGFNAWNWAKVIPNRLAIALQVSPDWTM
jgi:hypothetical protein